jgi:uncharacterized protein (TIGR02145 family)
VYGQGTANAATNLATYGRLYNGHAVSDTRGLCPTGWHVPTDAEWATLESHLGGASVAGNKMKSSSTDSPSWDGTNSSGFSALPGGFRFSVGAWFLALGASGVWWSSSPSGSEAWGRGLTTGNSAASRDDSPAVFGFSVRCVRD